MDNSNDNLSQIAYQKLWTWLRKENLLRETEFLLIAAENNAKNQ